MRKEYDFSKMKGQKNPYIKELKAQVSKELGLIPKLRPNTTGTEWYAMMYVSVIQ